MMQQKLASQEQIDSLLNGVPALKVWKCIKDNGSINYKEIMKITKIPQATVFRMIKELLKLDLIEYEEQYVKSRKSRGSGHERIFFSTVKEIKF